MTDFLKIAKQMANSVTLFINYRTDNPIMMVLSR